jgi:hypothetical protein
LLLFFRFLSCRQLLFAGRRFGFNPDGPDKAQQFACGRRHGRSLILASSHQRHVALVHAVLRFPCDLGDLCRKPFLSFAQLGPDAGQVSIALGRFDHDPSEVRVA